MINTISPGYVRSPIISIIQAHRFSITTMNSFLNGSTRKRKQLEHGSCNFTGCETYLSELRANCSKIPRVSDVLIPINESESSFSRASHGESIDNVCTTGSSGAIMKPKANHTKIQPNESFYSSESSCSSGDDESEPRYNTSLSHSPRVYSLNTVPGLLQASFQEQVQHHMRRIHLAHEEIARKSHASSYDYSQSIDFAENTRSTLENIHLPSDDISILTVPSHTQTRPNSREIVVMKEAVNALRSYLEKNSASSIDSTEVRMPIFTFNEALFHEQECLFQLFEIFLNYIAALVVVLAMFFSLPSSFEDNLA